MSDTDLPIPDFDQLSLGDLRHRIRSLDAEQLNAVLTHEAGHAARVPVLEILEARQRELEDGAQPSPGDPTNAPPVQGASGGYSAAAGHSASVAALEVLTPEQAADPGLDLKALATARG